MAAVPDMVVPAQPAVVMPQQQQAPAQQAADPATAAPVQQVKTPQETFEEEQKLEAMRRQQLETVMDHIWPNRQKAHGAFDHIDVDATRQDRNGHIILRTHAGDEFKHMKVPDGKGGVTDFIGIESGPVTVEAVNGWVAQARLSGWNTIVPQGDESHKEMIWLAAMEQNLEALKKDPNAHFLGVKGFSPDENSPALHKFMQKMESAPDHVKEAFQQAWQDPHAHNKKVPMASRPRRRTPIRPLRARAACLLKSVRVPMRR